MSALLQLDAEKRRAVHRLVKVACAYTSEDYLFNDASDADKETIARLAYAISTLRRRLLSDLPQLSCMVGAYDSIEDLVVATLNVDWAARRLPACDDADTPAEENAALLSFLNDAMEPRDDDPMVTGGACSIDLIGKPGYRGNEHVLATRPEVKP